jgi:catechol 2,3-dioxygenase-like lactoylglutathione lyase family enzyme
MAQAQTVRPTEGLFAPPRRIDTLADLFANVWQLGYVTTDLDRAIEFVSERFGLTHVLKLPTGGATFLIGDLIEPVAGEVDFYRRLLPDDGSFAVRLHHLAVFIENGEAEWERTRTLLADAGLRFDYTVLIPDRVRAGYVDMTTELGHWLEICQLHREDTDFFSALVSDSA